MKKRFFLIFRVKIFEKSGMEGKKRLPGARKKGKRDGFRNRRKKTLRGSQSKNHKVCGEP